MWWLVHRLFCRQLMESVRKSGSEDICCYIPMAGPENACCICWLHCILAFPNGGGKRETEREDGQTPDSLASWLHSKHLVNEKLACCCCCCSVTQSFLTLCNPMDCSRPSVPVLHHLLELAQTHVHQASEAIQPSDPLSSPSPPAFNLSQHQGLFQWVSSSHQVAKVLELQHQSFQWIFRLDLL